MTVRRFVVLALMLVCLGGVILAQDEELPLSNWGAPPYWTPSAQPAQGERAAEGGMIARVEGMQAQAEALPSAPLPFVAIAPCRIVDTRVAVSDGFHQPNFGDAEARAFPFPSSPDCPGLPATIGAYSLNIQFRPLAQLAFLTAFPTGTTMPLVSTLTAGPAAWVQNAALVPAGTGGAIDIFCQFAGRVVIDINGYYGPQSVVTSLNTLTGDVTLGEGSNVTITPSGNTLTIAATGGPGGDLPAGTANQTLYHNGSAWTATSALLNDGTNVAISGNLNLPTTTVTAGRIAIGGARFIHDYAGPGTQGRNTFVGQLAGNFAMGSVTPTEASDNTANGYGSLLSNTTGYANTATGSFSMNQNTTGHDNTAIGGASLGFNTTGYQNTATGAYTLYSNTSGHDNAAAGFKALYTNTDGYSNTAVGSEALTANTDGSENSAVGSQALAANTTGYDNTAVGARALHSNTEGDFNNAFGCGAMTSNVTGTQNNAFGHSSLSANTGNMNDAFGYHALWRTTTGSTNAAFGNRSLSENATGDANSAFGRLALNNSTETGNVAMGALAGSTLIAGSYNTFVGYSAGNDGGVPDLTVTNATAIGANALVTQNNSLVLGDTSVSVGIGTSAPNTKLQVVGNIRVGTSGTLGCVQRFDGTAIAGTCSSDARLKTDVRPFEPVLDRVARLQPVHFTWKAAEFPEYHFGAGTNSGLIAQDVEQVFPEMVATDENGYKMINFSELPYLTLAAVRELNARSDELAARNAALVAENADIRAELQRLAAAVAQLQARTRQK